MTSQITVVSGPPPSGRVAEPYRFQLEASGGKPPYSWRDPDKQLPAGLTLTESGVVAGTPSTVIHDKSVLVTVSDSGAKEGHAYLHFRIDPARTWAGTGSMKAARWGHAGTLLPDGRVLVTGGLGPEPLPSTEIYTTSTRLWSAAAPMSTARVGHASVALSTGEVLVCGGFYAGQDITASAQCYALPATWTEVQRMTWPRRDIRFGAVAMTDEFVLVAGGFTQKDTNKFGTNTAELYDVSRRSWSLTGSLKTVRFDHTVSLLRDGRVVAIGGFTGSGITNSTEVYDPGSRTWTLKGAMAVPRAGHTATVLGNGKVLVAGGFVGSEATNTAEIWDPTSDAPVATGSLTSRRMGHVAVRLRDGRVLVAGGTANAPMASAEIYDPWAATWYSAGSMAVPRLRGTATLLRSGEVLVTGGSTGPPGPTPTAELFG